LGLIQALQEEPLLQGFHLVGGTALALQMGHRISIDIDLFTRDDYDVYKTKYQQDDGLLILRSLVYFDDVDLAEWPRLFRETTLTFGQVKKRIIDAVKPLL